MNKERLLVLQLRRCRTFTEGRVLHAQAAASGGQDRQCTLVGNLLVQMYARCAAMNDARLVFSQLSRRNLHSWALLMIGFAQNGHLAEARSTFDLMPEVDVVSWTVMLVANAHAQQLGDAKALFDAMPERNVISWNAMLTAFAQNGQCTDARHTFHRMSAWGDVSYNALLHACVSNGEPEHALLIFQSMPASAHNVIAGNIMLLASSSSVECAWDAFLQLRHRDDLSWNTMLAAYGTNNSLGNKHEELYERMPFHGLVACTSMIRACAQRGRLVDAKWVFDAMPHHDHIAWNMLLAAYGQKGHIRQARQLLDSMPEWCSSSCNTMLQAYAGAKEYLEEAVRLFAGMEKPDEVACTAMISAYGHSGNPDEAWYIFSSRRCCFRDAKPWCTVLNAFARNERLEEAGTVLAKMPQWSVPACTSMLVGLAQCGRLVEAECVFERMAEQDHVSWTAMVTAYAHNGHAASALLLFKLMDLQGWRADKVTYVSVVQACCNLPINEEEGRRLHALFAEDGDYQLEASVAAALIHMYARCGLLEEAGSILEALPPRERLDARPWTAMMIANSQSGRAEDAIFLFRRLSLEGVEVRRIALASLICACAHAGLLEQGKHYVACSQVDYGVEASLDHYLCMLGLLGRAGELSLTEELLGSMPFEPDVVSWTILLASCKCLGDEERAARAAEFIFRLEPENVPARLLLLGTHIGIGSHEVDSLMDQKLYSELRSF